MISKRIHYYFKSTTKFNINTTVNFLIDEPVFIAEEEPLFDLTNA